MTKLKRIVLADDDEDFIRALAVRCKQLPLDVRMAHDGIMALELISAEKPDLVCLDVSMPGLGGLTLGELLARDERYSETPIIILTGQPAYEVLPRCHMLPAYYVPKGPDAWTHLEPLLKELLGPSAEPPSTPPHSSTCSQENLADSPPWVLCIDDDADLSMSLKLRLEARGVAVVRAGAGMEGFRCAFRYPADAIILDYNLPDGRGDYVLQRFKDNPVTKDIPVIVMTGEKGCDIERRLRRLGAANYFTKPVVFEDLLAELRNYIDVLSQDAALPFSSVICGEFGPSVAGQVMQHGFGAKSDAAEPVRSPP